MTETAHIFIGRDVHKSCGGRVFADTGQVVLCGQHPGCQRCKRSGWDGVLLMDTDGWRFPLCCDCFDEVDGDPDWDVKEV